MFISIVCLFTNILLHLPSHLKVFSTKKAGQIVNIVLQFHSQQRSQLTFLNVDPHSDYLKFISFIYTIQLGFIVNRHYN